MNDKIDSKDIEFTMKNCKVCGKITNENNAICKECFMTYMPKIKAFLNKNPNVIYSEVAFTREDIKGFSNKVLYEFTEAGLIKLQDKRGE